jgi:hypothetical protein
MAPGGTQPKNLRKELILMKYLLNALWIATALATAAAHVSYAAAQAPEQPAVHRTVAIRVGAGPTAFSGMEGGPVGGHGSVAITAHPVGSRFGVTAELLHERFAAQALYPCILVVSDRCVDSSERSVTAGVLSGSYYVTRATKAIGAVPTVYLIAGAGVYDSRRVAIQYPACVPDGLCAEQREQVTLRDTGVGVSGGVGAELEVRRVPLFMELRWHRVKPSTSRDAAGDTRFGDYSLVPFTVGIRF